MQSDTPYWTLSSNHTPIREVYLSNYDDTYYYFVTEDGCQRFNYTVSDPNRPLAEHQEKWEEIEAYFPNRYHAKLDIIGDWIYYNYGETGKARVNRQDLTQHEVLLPA